MPTLSLILFGLTVVLFATSLIVRRQANPNPALELFRKGLSIVILGLAAYYFYQRFTA
jgi:hypothetical protein